MPGTLSRRAFLANVAAVPAATLLPTFAATVAQPTVTTGSLIDAERGVIRSAMKGSGIGAAAVCLVEGGQVRWTEGFGHVSGQGSAAADASTMFSIQSTSKNFAAVAVLLAAALGWRYWQGHSSGSDAPLPEGVVGEAGPVTVEALPPSKVNATPDATPAQASDDAMMLADRDYPLVADADLYAWTAAGGPLPVDESQSRPSRPEPASATLETAAADE